MKYILIMMLITGGDAVSVHSTEFNDQHSCLAAGELWEKIKTPYTKKYYICAPKGDPGNE